MAFLVTPGLHVAMQARQVWSERMKATKLKLVLATLDYFGSFINSQLDGIERLLAKDIYMATVIFEKFEKLDGPWNTIKEYQEFLGQVYNPNFTLKA